MLRGKILLTGGTGTLGKAIVRKARECSWPAKFTILSRDEVKQSEMRREFPDLHYVLGNVSDRDWISSVVQGHDGIIHAAAYKQVPSAEANTREAIHANVIGSANIAETAYLHGVAWVVGVSTDKACAPVNAYGATKMLMERTFQEASQWGKTKFTLCRYGNVLGSRGSILPLFWKQIVNEEPITITDNRMTRFWLTTDDAVGLVCEAVVAPSGCIVVPDAPASTVLRLAQACIREFASQMVHGEVEIKEIGIRPGEKLHESLIHSEEAPRAFDSGPNVIVYPATTKVTGPHAQVIVSDQVSRQLSDSGLDEMVRSCA